MTVIRHLNMKTKRSKRKKAILISSLSQLKTKTERKTPKTRVKPVRRPKKTGFVALDGSSSVDVIRCVCWQEAGGVTRPASTVLRSIFPPFLLAAESQTSPSYLLSQTQTVKQPARFLLVKIISVALIIRPARCY